MAIDTAAKRRSAAGVPFLPLGPGVTPNASKPVAWRQQAGWGYSGIEAAVPAAADTGDGTWSPTGPDGGSWTSSGSSGGSWSPTGTSGTSWSVS